LSNNLISPIIIFFSKIKTIYLNWLNQKGLLGTIEFFGKTYDNK